ncbi:MAG: translation elongation factor Ts [Gammaproteobacteria bacterium]|nr:translation elongation factor Ts [Gammaproteobacteria bacterium]|tara:strand:+ start:96 stop:974 length:879 start_codon:yes stop_codon:yes gene_type:complete
MTIKAIDVKKLREITNAGMMDCKKALIESNGDFEKAKTILKEKGQSKADSKSGRTTAQGLVVIQSNEDHAVILEVNCETDFAAKDDLFTEFVDRVASIILQNDLDDMEQLDKQKTDDFDTVEEYRKFAISKLGENITIRRFKRIHLDGILGRYIHGSKIASLVLLDHHDSAELAKDIAMHVAASRPEYISNSDIPEEVIKEESRILRVQVEQEGKPEEIIDKIVDGKIKKQFDQLTLMGQEYVKDPDITVEKFLKDQDASVKSFIRYEVGEGIELDQVNFADEVKAQVDALK